MKRLLRAAMAAASFTLLSTPLASTALADSSIGFNGADVTIGYAGAGDGRDLTSINGTLDFAITRHHGLQLDLGAVDYGDTYFGTLTAHLYMQPADSAKYGVFFAYADADDMAASDMTIGIEGIWALGERLTASARFGIGKADPSQVDYIFGEFGADYALSDRFGLRGGAQITDIEETDLTVRAIDLTAGAVWYVPGAPLEVFAGVTHSIASGEDGAADETRFALTMTAYFGEKRGADARLEARRFAPVRPLNSLFARDMVAFH